MIPAYRMRNAVANSNEKAMRREWTGRIEEMDYRRTADESETVVYLKAGGIVLTGAAIILAAVFGFMVG